MLSDLRESGSIEQDADVVMFVFREEYYLCRAIPTQREGEGKEKFDLRYQEWFQRCQAVHNKAEVIIAKQRHGPIGNIQLQFDANFGRSTTSSPATTPSTLRVTAGRAGMRLTRRRRSARAACARRAR